MAIQIKVPSVGESVKEVTVANWPKKDGDWVEMDDVICEIESDKATIELTASAKGVLKIFVEAGEVVPVGHVIGEIDPEGRPASPSKETKKETSRQEVSSSGPDHYPSPSAKKILSEKNVDPKEIKGSGKGGRITKTDALKATPGHPQSPGADSSSMPFPPVKSFSNGTTATAAPNENSKDGKVLSLSSPAADPMATSSREARREKMSALRRTIAKRLVDVKNTTAMLTTFNEVDMSAVMDIRSKYKDSFKEKYQIGLGFMSFFTKAVTIALQEFPNINAMLNGDEIVSFNYCDVGIAVSTPRGLVVPVVRNAEKMSLATIEKEISRLALKARDNKISMDDMTGGTFTITNGGVFGSMLSTPILNAPQSAILGMHNIVERPVAIKGQVVIRPIMYLALSYDHRIVDGRESVGLLKKVKDYIEDPNRLLLGV